MKTKEAVGIALTGLGLILYLYTIVIGGMRGAIGVRGTNEINAILISLGMYAVLIGPALWLGEIPVAIKKFIEAKTGKKLS
ncbi:MAG: hypothetical protein RMH77_06795 [Sulfolobales archaeon]|nr:hypothetical protein [Sulfolobales archaeon]MCX8186564.1 hypothetical protein [Sulfolobales archaeon]MDW7970086.1 hypothetical protein [Sulfolobales archaeon]